jgi:hypothetical protein
MITVLPSLTVFSPSLTATVLPSSPLYIKGEEDGTEAAS